MITSSVHLIINSFYYFFKLFFGYADLFHFFIEIILVLYLTLLWSLWLNPYSLDNLERDFLININFFKKVINFIYIEIYKGIGIEKIIHFLQNFFYNIIEKISIFYFFFKNNYISNFKIVYKNSLNDWFNWSAFSLIYFFYELTIIEFFFFLLLLFIIIIIFYKILILYYVWYYKTMIYFAEKYFIPKHIIAMLWGYHSERVYIESNKRELSEFIQKVKNKEYSKYKKKKKFKYVFKENEETKIPTSVFLKNKKK